MSISPVLEKLRTVYQYFEHSANSEIEISFVEPVSEGVAQYSSVYVGGKEDLPNFFWMQIDLGLETDFNDEHLIKLLGHFSHRATSEQIFSLAFCDNIVSISSDGYFMEGAEDSDKALLLMNRLEDCRVLENTIITLLNEVPPVPPSRLYSREDVLFDFFKLGLSRDVAH